MQAGATHTVLLLSSAEAQTVQQRGERRGPREVGQMRTGRQLVLHTATSAAELCSESNHSGTVVVQAIACWRQAAELYQQALQGGGAAQAGGNITGAWRPRSLTQPLSEEEKQEALFGYAEVRRLRQGPMQQIKCQK
jgi:hypothetical protein